MRYKGQLVELGPDIMKVALETKTNADVGETIRKAFVYGMRQGENLCLDIGAMQPDFAAFDSMGVFNAETFFDWQVMNKEENYMQYVRENENHGIGGLNPGYGYNRSAKFSMVIRCGAETEE